MKLTIYQIDSFANKPFEGNPAAVVPLDTWLPESDMQSIAGENNLAETAFFVEADNGFEIRWFTPTDEVNLCGHATLASAYVIFNILKFGYRKIIFESKSGQLSVSQDDDLLVLDFPCQRPEACETPEDLISGLGQRPLECLKNEDYLAVFEDEEVIREIKPDHRYLMKLDLRGIIITAPSREYDFVVRFFAPKLGIPEDPVTGSAFTRLTPYWSERLKRTKFHARQVSPRGGDVSCELKGNRVLIAGKAVKYMEGTITI